jgi:hypothetical protein
MEEGLPGKEATLFATNLYLNDADCTHAIATIENLYNSTASDNEVRITRASAQGCAAGVPNFMVFLQTIIDNAASFSTGGFWQLMAKTFYTSNFIDQDRRVTASFNSSDALMATLLPGAVISPSYLINSAPNLGSVIAQDRTNDANVYMIFMSMATVGNLEVRYGAADSSGNKTQVLGATDASDVVGWTNSSRIDVNACGYAAAILNMFDSIDTVAGALSGNVASSVTTITTTFSSLMDDACDLGCQACGLAAGVCKGSGGHACPMTLRNRFSCDASVATNKEACAAAGMVNAIMTTPGLGW